MLGEKFNRSDNDVENHDSEEDPDDSLFCDGSETKTAHYNKELYMKNYSCKFEIPTSFVLNAHIFTRDTTYAYQLVRYVVPSEIRTGTKIRPHVSYFDDFEQGNLLLRVKSNGHETGVDSKKKEQQVLIKSHCQPITVFSADGCMFAYLLEEENVKSVSTNLWMRFVKK